MDLTIPPSGEIWVIDPDAQRATVIDEAGTLQAIHSLPAGFSLSPWPGRFLSDGMLMHYREAPGNQYGFDMVLYGRDLKPTAVFTPPRAPAPGEYFEGTTRRGSPMRARIPFSPRLVWRIDSQARFVYA
ncbi:MAG: hypothetical protein PVJ76_20165 [Gemmatimonadota bacterium]